ncbi:hypothetical protein LSAT2_019288 [Lamellibrachia satsuma]|nr:hypothetical protein LSAT2_019288 [Lamellibrachia satsuma]
MKDNMDVLANMSKVSITKRQRKANYTSHAIDVLVSEVATRRSVLFSRSGMNSTNEHKMREWEKITARMNLVCDTPRSVREIRKKWHTYCSEVRRKAIKRRRQAASHVGTAVHLIPREEKVLGLIPTIDDLVLSADISNSIDIDGASDEESDHEDGVLMIKEELDMNDTFVMSPKSESNASLPVINTYVLQDVATARNAGNMSQRQMPPQPRELEITNVHTQVDQNLSSHIHHMGAPVQPILVVPHNTVYTHSSSYKTASTQATSPEGATSPSQSTDMRLQAEQAQLAVDRERVAVERERLAVERELLVVKRRRLVVEEKKLRLTQELLRQGRGGGMSHTLHSLFGGLLK